MLRWAGSILIIVACSGIGFSKSRELKKHLQELEEVKKLFYLLKSELQYTKAPFPEVFEKLSKKLDEPYSRWLKKLSIELHDRTNGTFEEIWYRSVEENLKISHLKEDELQDLKNIGKNLEYMKSLDMYIEQLEYKIANTRESNRSKRKLCQSMGIMGGIFLVILLL